MRTDGDEEGVAHAGITSAAQALLADLEVHGILGEMMRPHGTPTTSFKKEQGSSGNEERSSGSQHEASTVRPTPVISCWI